MTATTGALPAAGRPSDRAPGPLRRFRGPVLSRVTAGASVAAADCVLVTVGGCPILRTAPHSHFASACFAAASIAASDFRT